jgi:redox-sensitive bicupin YhaK (pirin superfamily)
MIEKPDNEPALDARLDEGLDETFPASDPVAVHGKDVSKLRLVRRRHPALRDDIGELITRRPVPGPGLERLGAFLFLNHHGPQVYPPGNAGLPFGPHPHRGFETVTFILQGVLAHRDSAGNESVIEQGGVQWMTAGAGVIHEEVSPASFKRDGGALEILQLWINLPARLKGVAPRYVGVQRETIRRCHSDDGRCIVNLIAGDWQGANGPVSSLTGVFISTVEAAAGGRVNFEALYGRDVFLYVVRGSIEVSGSPVGEFELADLGAGDSVEIKAMTPAVFVFGHAEPINEPVVTHGPFVMNTAEEIRRAYADYQAGRFQNPV